MQKGRGASFGDLGGSANAAGSRASADGSERVRSTRKQATPNEEEARRTLASSSKLYYRIGEVSELTGVKAHVLRYWETEFRWMAPPKSRSKQRLYRKRDIEFVWLLKKLLWEQRYTIAGARQRIKDLGLEEALAHGGDAESLDTALLVPVGERGTAEAEAAGTRADPVRDASSRGDDGEGASPDWLGMRVALESMQGELLALRSVLQQGM